MVFYTGVGHPHHLTDSPVTLFISATTLARYHRRGEDFPVRMTGRRLGRRLRRLHRADRR